MNDKRIDPTTFYTKPELEAMLRGAVDVDDLLSRINVVKVTRNIFWGQHLVDAMNRYGCRDIPDVVKACSKGRKSKGYDLVDEAIEAQGRSDRK